MTNTLFLRSSLTISFLLTLGFSINAQEYLSETSKWYELSGDIFSNFYKESILEVAGDTTINKKTYKKIQITSSVLTLEPFTENDTIEYIPETISYRYIREDDKKFFWWFYEEDRLFADYNLEIGDNIYLGFEGNKPITSIDSMLVGGKYRKIFYVDGGGKIFEGIGTEKGLFEGLGISGDEYFSILKCYSQDGETFKINGRTPPAALEPKECGEAFLVNVPQIVDDNIVKVYPTITKNTVFIETVLRGNAEILLFNSLGKIVKQFQFPNFEKESINIEEIVNGLYFLKIEAGSKIYVRKILKR